MRLLYFESEGMNNRLIKDAELMRPEEIDIPALPNPQTKVKGHQNIISAMMKFSLGFCKGMARPRGTDEGFTHSLHCVKPHTTAMQKVILI